jgi:hypothetical protein
MFGYNIRDLLVLPAFIGLLIGTVAWTYVNFYLYDPTRIRRMLMFLFREKGLNLVEAYTKPFDSIKSLLPPIVEGFAVGQHGLEKSKGRFQGIWNGRPTMGGLIFFEKSRDLGVRPTVFLSTNLSAGVDGRAFIQPTWAPVPYYRDTVEMESVEFNRAVITFAKPPKVLFQLFDPTAMEWYLHLPRKPWIYINERWLTIGFLGVPNERLVDFAFQTLSELTQRIERSGALEATKVEKIPPLFPRVS